MMMASLQAAVKMCASRQLRPRDLCDNVNRLMFQNLCWAGIHHVFLRSDRTREWTLEAVHVL